MTKAKSPQPTSGQGSKTKNDKSQKKEPRIIRIKIGPFEFEGPVDLVVAVILGILVGGIGIVAAIYLLRLPKTVEDLASILQPSATAPPVIVDTPGAAITQTAINTPAPSGEDFSFEHAPLTAFGYSGIFDTDKTIRGMGLLSVIRKGSSGTAYKLEYRLPEEDEPDKGYAGLALRFDDPPDWTAYGAIEVAISFGDPQARCEMGIMDIEDRVAYFPLGDRSLYIGDITATISDREDVITIPFETRFGSINRKFIQMVLFNVDTDMSHGNHSFTINSLRLIKPADGASP